MDTQQDGNLSESSNDFDIDYPSSSSSSSSDSDSCEELVLEDLFETVQNDLGFLQGGHNEPFDAAATDSDSDSDTNTDYGLALDLEHTRFDCFGYAHECWFEDGLEDGILPRTALFYAILDGDLACVQRMGIPAVGREVSENPEYFLCVACESGNWDLVQWLLQNTALSALVAGLCGTSAVAIPDRMYSTVPACMYACACRTGDVAFAAQVYDLLCSWNVARALDDAQAKTQAFVSACRSGNKDVANMVYSLGDVQVKFTGVPTPFVMACRSGSVELVQWLHQLGGCSSLDVAFYQACCSQNLALVKWMWDAFDSHILAPTLTDAVYSAVLHGPLALVEWLIQQRHHQAAEADTDTDTDTDTTPNCHPLDPEVCLVEACRSGNLEVARYVLDTCFAQQPVPAPCQQTVTQAFVAAFVSGNLELVQWVLALGPTVDPEHFAPELAAWALTHHKYRDRRQRTVALPVNDPLVKWVCGLPGTLGAHLRNRLFEKACESCFGLAKLMHGCMDETRFADIRLDDAFEAACRNPDPDVAVAKWVWSLGGVTVAPRNFIPVFPPGDGETVCLETRRTVWLMGLGFTFTDMSVDNALEEAVTKGNEQFATWLIMEGPTGRCDLAGALMASKSVEFSQWLQGQGADVQADAGIPYFNAFHAAINQGDVGLVTWLHDHGAYNICFRDVFMACMAQGVPWHRRRDVAQFLLKHSSHTVHGEKNLIMRTLLREEDTPMVLWLIGQGGFEGKTGKMFPIACAVPRTLATAKALYALGGVDTPACRRALQLACVLGDPQRLQWILGLPESAGVDLEDMVRYALAHRGGYVCTYYLAHLLQQREQWVWPDDLLRNEDLVYCFMNNGEALRK
jgi:hypothetical protein